MHRSYCINEGKSVEEQGAKKFGDKFSILTHYFIVHRNLLNFVGNFFHLLPITLMIFFFIPHYVLSPNTEKREMIFHLFPNDGNLSIKINYAFVIQFFYYSP